MLPLGPPIWVSIKPTTWLSVLLTLSTLKPSLEVENLSIGIFSPFSLYCTLAIKILLFFFLLKILLLEGNVNDSEGLGGRSHTRTCGKEKHKDLYFKMFSSYTHHQIIVKTI